MRILLLNHNVAFKGGGTFYRALELGRFLVQRGHRVTLIASSSKPKIRISDRIIDGVQLIEPPGFLPIRWRYGYDYFEALMRIQWISHSQFEIVHAFDSRPTVIYPALFAKGRGARLVMDWCDWFGHGGAVEERSNPLLRVLLRSLESYYEESFRHRADASTVISPTLEKRALELGIPAETILQLPSGVDPEKLKPQDKLQARHKLNLPGDIPIIGYLGSLFQTDADLMVQAFSKIQNIHPRAKLILVGNPKARIPIIAGIMRTGFISQAELNAYLAACDILWLPLSDTIANRGRWPSKIVDYFASGRPIVACAVGDVPGLLEKTQAGVTCPPTPDEFAQQTLQLLKDDKLINHLAINARRVSESDFNWGCLVKSVEAQYLGLL